jgi:hypothetical protein
MEFFCKRACASISPARTPFWKTDGALLWRVCLSGRSVDAGGNLNCNRSVHFDNYKAKRNLQTFCEIIHGLLVMHRCRVRPSCPIDSNCYLAVPRSIAVLFGTPGDVSGSRFNGLVFHDVSRSPRGRGADRGTLSRLPPSSPKRNFTSGVGGSRSQLSPRFYRRSYFGDF